MSSITTYIKAVTKSRVKGDEYPTFEATLVQISPASSRNLLGYHKPDTKPQDTTTLAIQRRRRSSSDALAHCKRRKRERAASVSPTANSHSNSSQAGSPSRRRYHTRAYVAKATISPPLPIGINPYPDLHQPPIWVLVDHKVPSHSNVLSNRAPELLRNANIP
jgi:hypothetical protein